MEPLRRRRPHQRRADVGSAPGRLPRPHPGRHLVVRQGERPDRGQQPDRNRLPGPERQAVRHRKQGGVYTVNSDAQARKVSQLTVALAGTYFGVDFNPAANRLRVISNTGQNLRHNIDDPAAPRTTTVDGTLTNPTTPPSTALGVTGAAYTNNDLNTATATTLFDIDTVNDRVSLQSPANAGTLAPTGSLGVNAGPSAGFDIYYKSESGDNKGFAALNTGGAYRFYSVNILDGETTLQGTFPAGRQVFDIALPLNQN